MDKKVPVKIESDEPPWVLPCRLNDLVKLRAKPFLRDRPSPMLMKKGEDFWSSSQLAFSSNNRASKATKRPYCNSCGMGNTYPSRSCVHSWQDSFLAITVFSCPIPWLTRLKTTGNIARRVDRCRERSLAASPGGVVRPSCTAVYTAFHIGRTHGSVTFMSI